MMDEFVEGRSVFRIEWPDDNSLSMDQSNVASMDVSLERGQMGFVPFIKTVFTNGAVSLTPATLVETVFREAK